MVRYGFSLVLPFIPALAEGAPEGFDFGALFNYGVCGIILGWTLWRAEPRLRAIEAAIDRLTRLLAIMFTELPHVMQAAKDQCNGLLGEIKTAARNRGEKLEGE